MTTTSMKPANSRPSGMKKLLNDDRIPPLPVPVKTSVPLSPTKHISMSIAKSKKLVQNLKKKQMDHYVLKTVKDETSAEGDETIDFVLTDNDAERRDRGGLSGPSGEITEELHLSGDEEDDGEGVEKTEEIVEHVCGKCYKSFRRFSGLKKHLDFCRFDSGYHLRKAEMLKNLDKIEKDAIVMENKDVCFCCGENYDTFHLGHINCPDCPKSFKSQMSYERHIFITHSEADDFPCTICNAKLRTENLLQLHEEQHKNRGKPFACKICGKDFTRSYHLKRHQKYSACSANENDSMNCKVCNKVFYRLDNLRSHLKQHLGTHASKKPEYMCPICKNCFYSLSTLNIHTRTHTGERPFDCDLCDKKFPSLVALKKHRRYHTGEKPYTCSVCSQSFAVKEVLNRHMKRHTGERPHKCPECGKSFIQATQVRSHLKTHIRPFNCIDCKENFKTEKQLQRHAKTHSRKRKTSNKFQCETCKVSFPEEEQLKKHIEEGGKKCNLLVQKSQAVKRKRRATRTDCAVCEKNFDTPKSLLFHILKVHEMDPEEFVNEKPSSKDGEVPPPKMQKIEEEDENDSELEFISTANVSTANKTATLKVAAVDNEENKVQKTDGAGGVVVQEFILHEVPSTSANQTIVYENESYTVIPLDSEGIIEPITTNTMPLQISNHHSPEVKKEQKKSLAESLAAAIADDDIGDDNEADAEANEDLKLKENVRKLLDMLVDNATLKKFGWPDVTEENVLCKVIENCGHDLSKDSESYEDCDYSTRMREYVKLLFTVVIHNDSIKELLNNYPIDEVIEYVLGNDDDDDDDDGDADK